jgi:hypothetical protein
MSIVIYLREATPNDVSMLIHEPDKIDVFVHEGLGECPNRESIDFDKAWDALHFMLTGVRGYSESPLNILYPSESSFHGGDEQGYGAFWIIEPKQVLEFNQALNALSDVELSGRYRPAEFVTANVYLSDAFEEEGLEALPYVMQGVPDLRKLADRAALAGNFIVGREG